MQNILGVEQVHLVALVTGTFISGTKAIDLHTSIRYLSV